MPKGGITPDALKTPHVRVDVGNIQGYESGYRSGLLSVDSEWYKAKGCRPTNEDFHGGPYGTQTYSFAQNGADKILERREVFLREGFSYPIEPIGFWVYNHIKFNGEPTAATLYRIEGDMFYICPQILFVFFKQAVEKFVVEINDVTNVQRLFCQNYKRLREFYAFEA